MTPITSPITSILTLRAKLAAIKLYVADFETNLDLLARQLADPGVVIPLSIGRALAVRRKSLGLSQDAVAKAAHLSRSEVSEIERGTRHAAESVGRVAEAILVLETQQREQYGELLGNYGRAG
jgi:DNA-binding XRE family transcriptional regulator